MPKARRSSARIVLGPPLTAKSAKKGKSKKGKRQSAEAAAAARKARARAIAAERRKRVVDRTEEITAFIRSAGITVEPVRGYLVVDGRRSVRVDDLGNARYSVYQFLDAIVARSCPRVLLEQLRDSSRRFRSTSSRSGSTETRTPS